MSYSAELQFLDALPMGVRALFRTGLSLAVSVQGKAILVTFADDESAKVVEGVLDSMRNAVPDGYRLSLKRRQDSPHR
jgi:hypothetical protein